VVVHDETKLAALMRSALAGDERAYGDFLGRTAALVRTLARRKLRPGSGIDVEDIVQETLMAVHVKRHTWRAGEPITPWLAAIARYKVVDAFRSRGSVVEVDISELVEILPAPEVEPLRHRDVSRALEALGDGQRRVVSSIAIEGHSIRDTAERYGMTEVAVRVALHRGLAAIRNNSGLPA
jgi:RNA polymerase sigma-70 factor, ECF subfamily